MRLAFHGGRCCGIKTIYEMGGEPEGVLSAIDAVPKNNADVLYNNTDTMTRFFHEKAPKETYLERLDRYIAYCKTYRPSHIIEITLAQGAYCNQKKWDPLLEERGFVKTIEGRNSNSGNTVRVFHLAYDLLGAEVED